MGTNDAREQLEVCKKVTVKQEEAIRGAIVVLNNIHIGAPEAIRRATEILQEALR